jgi:flagellar hook-length control protein FliK
VDSARLLTRVIRAFSAAQERDGEVRLRLSPPELGALRLEIRVENGALTARLQTETDSARTAIIDNLPVLRERLAEQGVRIERFDVDLMQRQPGGMPDQSGGRQPETTEAPPRFLASSRTPNSTTPQPVTSAPLVDRTGGLNVIV